MFRLKERSNRNLRQNRYTATPGRVRALPAAAPTEIRPEGERRRQGPLESRSPPDWRDRQRCIGVCGG